MLWLVRITKAFTPDICISETSIIALHVINNLFNNETIKLRYHFILLFIDLQLIIKDIMHSFMTTIHGTTSFILKIKRFFAGIAVPHLRSTY